MVGIMAGELVIKEGEALVGRELVTPALGAYPGGFATVTELAPDPAAPEIVFNVHRPGWGEIGVFDLEVVVLVPNEED